MNVIGRKRKKGETGKEKNGNVIEKGREKEKETATGREKGIKTKTGRETGKEKRNETRAKRRTRARAGRKTQNVGARKKYTSTGTRGLCTKMNGIGTTPAVDTIENEKGTKIGTAIANESVTRVG